MNPLVVSVIAVAVIVIVAVIVVSVFWLRRSSRGSPAAPPTAMPAPTPTPPHASYPFEDEWEAHAPYPDYIHHDRRPSASPYRPTSDPRSAADAHFRHRDAFEFDDVEAFESPSAPPSQQADRSHRQDAGFPIITSALATSTARPQAAEGAIRCPRCSSTRIDTFNVARTAGSTIGSVAGATGGFAMALSGAEAGATVGAIGGPLGAVFGGLTGAVIAGLLGSAAGNAAGSALGAVIDESILDNYWCISCGHTFGAQHT